MKGWSYSLICGVLSTASAFASAEWMGVPFATSKSNDSTVDTARTFNTSTSDGKLAVDITTPGQDIWYTLDRGSFYFAPEIGDCEVVATIPPVLKEGDNINIGNSAKAGVMFRLSTYASAPMVMFLRETTLTNEVGEASCKSRMIYRSGENSNAVDLKTTTSDFPPNADVRCRLVREDNLFTAYYSTNTPYADWIKFADWTAPDGVFPDGILGGLALAPQVSSATIAVTFDDVTMRQRVSTEAAAGAITVTWPTGALLSEGDAVEDYTVSRTETGSEAWSPIASVDGASATTFEDTSAVVGTSYRYRVAANVQHVDESAGSIAVGDSYEVRIPLQTSNANPGTMGFAMQYSQNDQVVGSLVYKTSVYNPWDANLDPNDPRYRIYPNYAEPNLDGLDNFSIQAQGVLRVTSSGLYTIRQLADDLGSVSVNGQLIVNQADYIPQSIYSSPFYLEAGKNYPIAYTFMEKTGGQALQLRLHRVGSGDNYSTYAGPSTDAVPHPWTAVDLGASPIFGSTVYNLDASSFSLYGSGLGWTNAYDEVQACTLPLAAGDFDFIARLVLTGSDAASRGILIRTAPFAEAPEQVVLSVVGDSALVHVRTAAGEVASTYASVPLPSSGNTAFYLRFARRDGTLQCLIADGLNSNLPANWTPVGDPIMLPEVLSGDIVGGLCVASGNRTGLASAQFDNVSAIDDLSLTVALQANPNGTASVGLVEVSSASRRADIAASIAAPAYLWTDAVSQVVTSYNLNAFEGIPTNVPGPVLATDIPAGTTVPYTYTSEDPYAIAFFTVQGQTTIFGSDAPGSALDPQTSGFSRVPVSSNGTGLFVAYYKTDYEGPRDNPNAKELRGLNSWDYAQDGNWRTATGTDIGQKNFHAIFSGYLTPPHSGYYRIHQTANGSIIATLGGMNLFSETAVNRPAASFSTDWIYLEGGQRLPFFVAYRNYNTSGGVFSLQWEHGGGTEMGIVNIPITALSSDLSATAPNRVVAGSADTFGNWTDLQWGASRAGQSFIHGSLASDILKPESMNVVLLSCNAWQDFERTYDLGHFLYRSVPADQDFLFEATVSKPTGYSGWLRQGLMIRSSVASNAPAIAVFRTKNGRLYSQVRTLADTKFVTKSELTGNDAREVRIRIERTGSIVRTYSDDELTGSYSTKSWTEPIQVGFVGGSYDAQYNSIVFFSNSVFKGLPKPCTVFIVR